MSTMMGMFPCDFGPGKVTYKGTALGYTRGGIQVSVEVETRPIKIDLLGVPVAEALMGGQIIVSCPFAEPIPEILRSIFPWFSGITIGDDLLELAGTLTVFPAWGPAAGITFADMLPSTRLQSSFATNGERIWSAQFKGYLSHDLGQISFNEAS